MKRNIAYVKPQDPTFLAKLKTQIGYQDRADELEAKRSKHTADSGDEDFDTDREDEKPQYVTEDGRDELPQELVQQFTKENIDEPKADLEQRIVFKSKSTSATSSATATALTKASTRSVAGDRSSNSNSSRNSTSKAKAGDSNELKKSKGKTTNKVAPKLSFNYADEEEEDE